MEVYFLYIAFCLHSGRQKEMFCEKERVMMEQNSNRGSENFLHEILHHNERERRNSKR